MNWFDVKQTATTTILKNVFTLDLRKFILLQEQIGHYGIDWDGPVNTDGDNLVEVPDTSCPLDDDKLQLLRQRIDLTTDDRNYGIHTFNQLIAEVTNLIHS